MADRFITCEIFRKRLAARGITANIWTVRRWCKAQKIDARRVGIAWLILETEVDRVAEVGVRSDLDETYGARASAS